MPTGLQATSRPRCRPSMQSRPPERLSVHARTGLQEHARVVSMVRPDRSGILGIVRLADRGVVASRQKQGRVVAVGPGDGVQPPESGISRVFRSPPLRTSGAAACRCTSAISSRSSTSRSSPTSGRMPRRMASPRFPQGNDFRRLSGRCIQYTHLQHRRRQERCAGKRTGRIHLDTVRVRHDDARRQHRTHPRGSQRPRRGHQLRRPAECTSMATVIGRAGPSSRTLRPGSEYALRQSRFVVKERPYYALVIARE